MLCVGRGLCDGLITRPEESYRVSLYVCDQETPNGRLKVHPGLQTPVNELMNECEIIVAELMVKVK
jgi:hypothetical protein